MRRIAATLGLTLAFTACSSVPRPGAAADAAIAELQARVLTLQRQTATMEVQLARLRQEIAALRSGGAPVSALRPPAAAPPRASEPPPPIRSGTGAAETRPPVPPSSGIEESDLEPESVPEPSPQAGSGVVPIVTLEPVSRDAQALYDQAYTLFHQGRFVESETAFRGFLENHPRSELADNATYWVGESRYSRGDLRGALAVFQEAVERYPTGNKVADALVKVGQCFEGLGDPTSAREAYDVVLAQFAETGAAAVARERRSKLR